jgi:hypothetical protein
LALSLGNVASPLLGGPLLALPLLVLNALVLLADCGAAVLALYAADLGVLLAAVTAELVIADAIVDEREGDVRADVALVVAPKPGEDIGGIGRPG